MDSDNDQTTANADKPFRLLDLPAELRLTIYEFYVSLPISLNPLIGSPGPSSVPLKQTSKKLYHEVKPVIRDALHTATNFSIHIVDFNFYPLARACERKLAQPTYTKVEVPSSRRTKTFRSHITRSVHIHIQLELSSEWRNPNSCLNLKNWILWLNRRPGYVVTYADVDVERAETSFASLQAYSRAALLAGVGTRMNKAENRKHFGEVIEAIGMGAVKWWVRNRSNTICEEDLGWMDDKSYQAENIRDIAGICEGDRFGYLMD